MRRFALSVVVTLLFMASASAENRWSQSDKGDFIEVVQRGGRTLGYSQTSGIKLLEVDGFLFKDLNRNGRLDIYEDWRRSSEERSADLASQMSIEQIAGLMLYSSHQRLPASASGVSKGTYNGKIFSESYASPEDLTDQQKKFIIEDGVRHVLVTKVQSPYVAAEWNNKMQSLCEGIGLGIPANNSSDPRHGPSSEDEFSAGGGGRISAWPAEMGLAATFDPAQVRRFAEIAATEYRALGVTTALSPQVDLATEPRWRRMYMGFTESPELCADIARAYADGFQTSKGDAAIEGAWGTQSVNAMVKHWPGGGGGEAGRDAHLAFGKYAVYPGNNFEEQLRPFVDGAFRLKEGTMKASAVMPYYTISYGQDPSGDNVGNAYSKYIIHDLLRTKYGYDGVICTDWRVVLPYESLVTNTGGKPWGVEHLSDAELCYRVFESGIDQFGGVNTSEHILGAYRLMVERKGEKAARERFELSARRLLRNIFRVGLFENAYLEPAESQRVAGCDEFVKAGFEAQLKSIIMLKNHNNVLPLNRDGRRAKVFIEHRHFGATTDWWTGRRKNDAHDGYGVDIELVKHYFDVVENPAEADCALVFVDAPLINRGYSDEDVAKGGNGYMPISLQYRPYTATHARAVSIAGGDPKESFTNRSYKGKTTAVDNEYELDAILRARKLMGKRPVVVVVKARRPLCFGEFEGKVDGILMGFKVQNRAYLEILSGNAEPSGLLPLQQPKDMRAVERQMEDVPFDMECYKDADGNRYDFAFGLNWSGVIRDWRVERYGDKDSYYKR